MLLHDEELVRDYRFPDCKTRYVRGERRRGIISTEGQLADQVRDYSLEDASEFVVVCSKLEAEIAQLETDEERTEYLSDGRIWKKPGLTRVIRTGYRLLGLHHFFTIGAEEVRAWTIPIGYRRSDCCWQDSHGFRKRLYPCGGRRLMTPTLEYGGEAGLS